MLDRYLLSDNQRRKLKAFLEISTFKFAGPALWKRNFFWGQSRMPYKGKWGKCHYLAVNVQIYGKDDNHTMIVAWIMGNMVIIPWSYNESLPACQGTCRHHGMNLVMFFALIMVLSCHGSSHVFPNRVCRGRSTQKKTFYTRSSLSKKPLEIGASLTLFIPFP